MYPWNMERFERNPRERTHSGSLSLFQHGDRIHPPRSSVSRSRRNLRSFLLLLPANKSRYDRILPAVVGQERKVYKAGVGISEGSILLLLLCSSERGRAAITVYYDVIHDAGRDNNRRMAFEALERCSVRLATRGGGGERTPLAWPRTRYRRCSSA